MTNRLYAFALCALIAAVAAPPARASEDLLVLGAGYYDVFDDNGAADFRIDYRWNNPLVLGIKPFLGAEVTSDSAIYGLGGLYVDWGLAPHWYVTPSIGAGLYHEGSGKDLGNGIEFRSQLEIAYEFETRHRLAAGISHISNAGLGDDNPGTEILSLSLAIPVGGTGD